MQASKRKETLAAYTFLAPGFLLFALVVLYPIARAFQISLYHWSIVPGTASQYIGLGNYGHALHDPIFWRALANTGAYMAFTVPAQIVLGMAVAVLLDARMPARGLFRTLYYLPVVTSWVVVSLLFRYMFITDGGLVNFVLHDKLHLVGHNIDWLVAPLVGARRDQHPRHLEGDRLVDGDLPRRAADRAARAEGSRRRRRREGVGAVPRRLAARRSCR